MAGFNLGDVFVTIKAVTDDFQKGLSAAQDKLGGFGGFMSSALGKAKDLALGIAAVGATGVAAIGALTLKGGFERALNIQDAVAKLKGLGYGLQDVQTITNATLDAVRGTAYSLDQAMTIASTALAAGIKPGKELTKYLQGVADAATIAGSSLGDMGAIFNQVQANGKLATQQLQMLQDRGLPVLQWLAKSYGVSAAAMTDMVSKGKVDSQRFLQVMNQNIGGAALKSGDTVRGAFANMEAAFSRLGASLVTQYLPVIQSALEGITKWVDAHQTEIVAFVGKIGDLIKGMAPYFQYGVMAAKAFFGALQDGDVTSDGFIGRMEKIGAWLHQLSQGEIPWVNNAIKAFKEAWDFLKPSIDLLWDVIVQNLIPALSNLWHNFIEPLLPLLGILLTAAIWIVINVLTIVIQTIANVANAFGDFGKFIQGIGYNIANFFSDIPRGIMQVSASIFAAIIAPYKQAFDWLIGAAKATMNTVKGWLDPTQRHSPSMVDRVQKGLLQVQDLFSGMYDSLADMSRAGAVATFAPGLMPVGIRAGSSGGGGSASAYAGAGGLGGGIQVVVDLSNTNIVGTVPRDVAESIGDAVVKRLQQSVRI